jgi:hypothetical protein
MLCNMLSKYTRKIQRGCLVSKAWSLIFQNAPLVFMLCKTTCIKYTRKIQGGIYVVCKARVMGHSHSKGRCPRQEPRASPDFRSAAL